MTRFATTAALVLFAAPLAAQDAANTDDSQRWGARDGRDGSYLVDVTGADVLGADAEKIGEIAAILVDESGRPAAFHVEIGGWLDLGDEDVAVPLDAFTHGPDGYTSKMTVQQLRNLPEWDG